MKKILSVIIAVVLAVSVMAIATYAEGETLKVYVGNEATTASLIPSGVTLEQSGDGVIVTTVNATDPWVSVELEGVDLSVYKFFTVKYRCDTEIGSNNTYLKTAGYVGDAEGGYWDSNGMGGTADNQWHTIEYSIAGTGDQAGNNGFAAVADQTITGVRLTACGAEGGKFEIAWLRFTVDHYEEPAEQPGQTSEKSADQWLCGEDPGAATQPGWWFNPVGQPDDRYVEVKFTAEGYFSGVHGFYYCSNPDGFPELDLAYAHMTIQLIKDGAVVAEKEMTPVGDAWYDVDFGKAFGPGEYSLKYSCKDGSGIANNCWCVIGFCGGSGSTTVEANVNAPAAGSYPALMLIGAAPEGSNPGSGDAAIIAIAAVGCIALAGVVVAKKVR